MSDHQGPEEKIEQATESPLLKLARLNQYDIVGRELEGLIANGELADYDDEIANRVKDAIKIVRGLCELVGVPLRYEPEPDWNAAMAAGASGTL